MSKVSVVIPCYNCENYILKCLRSLESQTFSDFEVILVDDYSKDNTVGVIRRFIKRSPVKMRLIQNSKNLGPGETRNRGIREAQSEYISFCDSDDWYSENFLEYMVAGVSKNNDDIAVCNGNRITSSGKVKRYRWIDDNVDSSHKESVLIMNNDSLCSMMVRRSLFDKVSLPEIYNGEDMAVIPVLVAKAQGIVFVKSNLYNYLYRERSLSNTKDRKVIESLETSYQCIFRNIAEDFYEECEYIGIKIILYGGVLTAYQLGLRRDEIKNIICEFEKKHPRWRENKYILNLPPHKRIFVRLISAKLLSLVKTMAFSQKILLNSGLF